MGDRQLTPVPAADPAPDDLRLFRRVATVSTVVGAAVLGAAGVLAATRAPTPLAVLGAPAGALAAGALAALWLSRRGRHANAVLLYLAVLTGALHIVVHVVYGATGPFAVALVVIPILAGLLAGGQAAFWMALLTIVLQAILFALSYWGVLPPQAVLGPAPPWAYLATLLSLVVVVASLASASADRRRQALAAAAQRGADLAAEAQHAAAAEGSARAATVRQEAAARQLRRSLTQFATFLEQVSAGDYTARLSLEGYADGAPDADELQRLASRLAASVDLLTGTLAQMEGLQARYTREAWSAFARSGRAPTGLWYEAGRIRTEPGRWLPLMSRAVTTKTVATDGAELAVPIMLAGELIGVLGAQHAQGPEGSARWSEDELAVVAAAVDQLSQTLEALRLLDRMQRSASREQLALQISERVRGATDVEEIMRVVSHALGRELGASEVVVQLGTERTLLEEESL